MYIEQEPFWHCWILIATILFYRSAFRIKVFQIFSTASRCNVPLGRYPTYCDILIYLKNTGYYYFSSYLVLRRWLLSLLTWTFHSFFRTHRHPSTQDNKLFIIVHFWSQTYLIPDLLLKQRLYNVLQSFIVHSFVETPPYSPPYSDLPHSTLANNILDALTNSAVLHHQSVYFKIPNSLSYTQVTAHFKP